ncbi:MAG: hypothetical protein IIU43_08440, partial [Thermoguttaceae bacterium]|nr:hypothetical protein [Thermoguttaceae bacterium]
FRTVEFVDELARVFARAASLVRILTILFCRVKSDSKNFRRRGDFVHFGRSFLQIRRVSFIMERIDGDPPFGVLDSGVVFYRNVARNCNEFQKSFPYKAASFLFACRQFVVFDRRVESGERIRTAESNRARPFA